MRQLRYNRVARGGTAGTLMMADFLFKVFVVFCRCTGVVLCVHYDDKMNAFQQAIQLGHT